MTAETAPLVEPSKEQRFRRSNRLVDVLREVWASRPMVRASAEREIRAQYKQAALGVAWAIVNPIILMLVFTLLIRKAADIQIPEGVPPAIFSYVALVPWNFFSSSVTSGGLSIINQMALVNKIRCAREVFPLGRHHHICSRRSDRGVRAARVVRRAVLRAEDHVVLGRHRHRRAAGVHGRGRARRIGHHRVSPRPPPRATDPHADRSAGDADLLQHGCHPRRLADPVRDRRIRWAQ